jgi:simple sugar transport system ATP-binding protein
LGERCVGAPERLPHRHSIEHSQMRGRARVIHGRLRAAASGGAAVLFHSSDLDEVLELATRVIVVTRGMVTEAPPQASREEIGAMMLGGE